MNKEIADFVKSILVLSIVIVSYILSLYRLRKNTEYANKYGDNTFKLLTRLMLTWLIQGLCLLMLFGIIKNKIDISNQFCNYEDYQEFYFFDDFYPFLRYKILTTDAPTLKHLHLVDEGIENLLKEKVVITNHMDELITSLTSKRYTRSRIQRMLIHILMNNSKEDIAEAMQIDYIRVLKMNNVGQAYLNKIKNSPELRRVLQVLAYLLFSTATRINSV